MDIAPFPVSPSVNSRFQSEWPCLTWSSSGSPFDSVVPMPARRQHLVCALIYKRQTKKYGHSGAITSATDYVHVQKWEGWTVYCPSMITIMLCNVLRPSPFRCDHRPLHHVFPAGETCSVRSDCSSSHLRVILIQNGITFILSYMSVCMCVGCLLDMTWF